MSHLAVTRHTLALALASSLVGGLSCNKSKSGNDQPATETLPISVGGAPIDGGVSYFPRSVTPTAPTVRAQCDAGGNQTASGSTDPTCQSAFKITDMARIIVGPGDEVELTGSDFRPTMTIAASSLGPDAALKLSVASDTKAALILPSNMTFGLLDVTLTQDGVSQKLTLFSNGGATDYPIITAGVDQICRGLRFYDSQGVLQEGGKDCGGTVTPASCTRNGETGCLTTSAYQAADLSNLSPGNIRKDVTIAGVAGDYPSSTFPLNGADATTDLPAFGSASGGSSYEWFQSDGTRVTGSITADQLVMPGTVTQTLNAGVYRQVTVRGDANLLASNIKSGATIFGVAGSMTTPPSCTSDDQQECMVSGLFKAANVSGFSPWSLRVGSTLAGISGALKTNCRNTVSSMFNYDGSVSALPNTSVTAGTARDFWDTVDGGFYTGISAVTGWDANSTLCDASVWEDRTTIDGGSTFTTCGTSGGNSTCILQDRISNLQVTGVLSGNSPYNSSQTNNPATLAWNTAIQACNASTYGGYPAGTWRLPTQKELMSLYEHGISAMARIGFITSTNMTTPFWSSSTFGGAPSGGWVILLSDGRMFQQTKTSLSQAICVR